jgi:hypothetical protein
MPEETCTRWPQEAICEGCQNLFLKYRPQHRFCKEQGCNKLRQKERWVAWRERQEAAGTYRDSVNGYQQKYRTRTGYSRDWELRTKYGITLEFWLAYLDSINHKCEICGSEETLCVDHDHTTGIFRGALCGNCNRSIGQLGDTAAGLRKALAYLER